MPLIFFHMEFALFYSSFPSFLETNWRIFQKMHFPIIVYHYLQQRERTLHAMQLWCNFSRQQKVQKKQSNIFCHEIRKSVFFLHIFLWWRSPSYVLTFFSDMFSYFSHIFSDSALFHIFSCFSYFSLIVLTIICDECFRDADATASILENLGERNVHKM